MFKTWLSSHVDVGGTPTQAGLTLQKSSDDLDLFLNKYNLIKGIATHKPLLLTLEMAIMKEDCTFH